MRKHVCLFIVLFLAFFANAMGATARMMEQHCDYGKDAYASQILRRTVGVIAPQMSGSGVLLSANEVLMSAHLVENNKVPVIVVTCEWESIRGTVVWVDTELDLALIRIETKVPSHFTMRSGTLPIRAGEHVWTVGQPYDLPWAVSGGVVIHPDQEQTVVMPNNARQQYRLIVSSAQTKQGGSGGALVDADGNLVGIVIAVKKDSSYALAQPIANFCRAYHHEFCLEREAGKIE